MTLNPRRIRRRRSRGPVHTATWDRCFKDVKARGGARSAAAVCTATLGEHGSILPGHRRRANPRKLSRRDRLRARVGALVGRPRWIVTDPQGNERLSNPRERTVGGPWIIVATKPGHTGMVYAGDRFVRANMRGDRYWRQGVHFPSRELAGRFARYLKCEHSRPLSGWSLRAWQVPAPHWWFK